LGVEIYGSDEKELFSNAAHALFDIMTDINAVCMTVERDIYIEGAGLEELLVNFLREMLYLLSGEGLCLQSCLVAEIDQKHVQGTVRGEFFDSERHSQHMEVKAVTYHRTEVKKSPHGWTARVIFDV
ncbi:MAG: archease, partial [Deltaproteobacteria bacterium]|nr:archease [Deltaproteobacteria bacterium]